MSTLFGVLLFSTSLFLVLLVLVQRGRGGGLTGALGGMGGQSAFGSKAGDVFTKITVWTTFAWILLCVLAVLMLGTVDDSLSTSLGGDGVLPIEGAMGTTLETDSETSTDTSTIPLDGTSPDGALPGADPAPTGTPSESAGEAPSTTPPSGVDQN